MQCTLVTLYSYIAPLGSEGEVSTEHAIKSYTVTPLQWDQEHANDMLRAVNMARVYERRAHVEEPVRYSL